MIKIFCRILFFLGTLIPPLINAQTAPNLIDDYDTADINTPVNVSAPGVLVNDTDADSDALLVTEFSVAGSSYVIGETATFPQGSISINADGSYIFTPNTGYTGDVTRITYTVSDGTFTNSAFLDFTVQETSDLLEFRRYQSCNQGYTIEEEYKIRYFVNIENTSTARDYHESSLVTNIDLTDDLETVFGSGCIANVEVLSVSTSETTDYINDPYPQEFNDEAINPDFLDITSTSIFSTEAINSLTLYPRQNVTIEFCVTIDAFCNGRPNPTASGSGIDFDNVLNLSSSTGTTSSSLSLTDFHSLEAIITAGFYVPDAIPTVNTDGTFEYTNTVIITNEGNATGNNVNYNMGLGRFLDDDVTFSELTITQVSGPTVTLNEDYDGDTNTTLLNTNTSLAAGETIILEIYSHTAPISSSSTNNFSQLSTSQTQGVLDGFNEDNAFYRRALSFVYWSDNLGDHLDTYYATFDAVTTISSTSQCNCSTSEMRFSFESSSSADKITSEINDAPNGILEHQEATFQIIMSNSSVAVQLENLQIEDDLDAICSGNIISVSAPIILNSTATINPTLNLSYNGTTDTNIFDGTSGLLEINQSVTVEYSVLFNKDCVGTNVAQITATDPLGIIASSVATSDVNASTDTDDDGIPNVIDIDDDNDTILDVDEYNGLDPLNDTDGDFIPDYRDLNFGADLNNDGIVDLFDFDNDGVPNHFDLDSDNDGIFDLVEVNNSNTSGDDDGMASTDDVGNNGLHNDVENNDTFTTTVNYTIPNTDNTGNANFIDIDADDDGIVDNIEAQTTFNYIAPNNMVSIYGVDTAYSEGISPTNSDQDTVFDYVDTNSDNDSRDDSIEGWDTNSDGSPETIPSNVDVDNDGLDDAYDTNTSLVNPTNNQTPNSFPDVDNTDNPEKDWREIIAVVIIIDDVSVNEGNDLTFTVSLVAKNDNTIPVQSATAIDLFLSTTDGTQNTNEFEVAIAPFDYNPISDFFLNIPSNQETATITIASIDDNIFELDELFSLNATITSNNTVNTEVTAIGTILNDENAPNITLNNSEAEEGDDLMHTISLSNPSSTPIIVNINTTNDTAINSLDYTGYSETLTITGSSDPNNANTEVSFVINTLTDNTNEADTELLNVIGTVNTDNVSTIDLTKTGTIIDIDPDPIVSITDAIAVEGNLLEFTFTLLNADSEPMFNYLPIDFYYETVDDTTTINEDYEAVAVTTLIPANTSSVIAPVVTIDDTLNEDTETLFLKIIVDLTQVSNDENILERIGTIKDNDIPNLFSPNGDGRSDTFKISGIDEFTNFKITIFDRWGSEVYDYSNNGNTNPTWWDGNYNGLPAPEGVYFYILDFNDNETEPKKNFIQLIR